MSDRYHYDKSGNYRGYSSNTPPESGGGIFIKIFIFLFILGLFGALHEKTLLYSEYSFPLNLFAGYYYCLTSFIIMSIAFIAVLFVGAFNFNLTSFHNLNFVIGILLCVLLLFLIIYLWGKIFEFIFESGYTELLTLIIIPSLLFLPGILWLITLLIYWLFSV